MRPHFTFTTQETDTAHYALFLLGVASLVYIYTRVMSGCLFARTLTLKLISLSLQQVTQFTNNTTKATSAVSDTSKNMQSDTDNVSNVLPPEMRRTHKIC